MNPELADDDDDDESTCCCCCCHSPSQCSICLCCQCCCESPSQVQDVAVELWEDDVEIDGMMTIAMMMN